MARSAGISKWPRFRLALAVAVVLLTLCLQVEGREATQGPTGVAPWREAEKRPEEQRGRQLQHGQKGHEEGGKEFHEKTDAEDHEEKGYDAEYVEESEAEDDEESDAEDGGKAEDGEKEKAQDMLEKGESVNIAVACTLLGGTAFVMATFYMVNHEDEDMKLYSWEVVSATVSIFVANLFFHALQCLIELASESLEAEGQERIHAFFQLLLFFLCLLTLHLTIVHYCNKAVTNSADCSPEALRARPLTPAAAQRKKDLFADKKSRSMVPEDELEGHPEIKDDDFFRLQCWAVLNAHVCGFAAMHAGAMLQRFVVDSFELEEGSRVVVVGAELFVVVLVASSLFWIFRWNDSIRTNWIPAKYTKPILWLWDETSEETENDVASLAISFAIAACIRTAITGEMPGPEEEPEECGEVEAWFIPALGACAAAAAVLRMALVRVPFFSADEHEASDDMSLWTYVKRWAFIIQFSVSMTFSWCLLSTMTAAASYVLCQMDVEKYGYMSTGAAVRAVLAMAISIIAFGMIWVLDWISDGYRARGKVVEADRAMRGLIRSLGIMVGFSWEAAFAGGLDAVVSEKNFQENSWGPVVVQFVLALIIGAGVVPAWRMYILRNLLQLQRVHKKKRREEEDSKLGEGSQLGNVNDIGDGDGHLEKEGSHLLGGDPRVIQEM